MIRPVWYSTAQADPGEAPEPGIPPSAAIERLIAGVLRVAVKDAADGSLEARAFIRYVCPKALAYGEPRQERRRAA